MRSISNYLLIFSLGFFLNPTFTLAVTDSVQVNLEVVQGSGGSGETLPVLGCTDPLATNYNSQATQNDGSCLYPAVIPNVSNFSANYSPNQINLTWQNPSFATFAAVRIVRGTSGFPTGPTDGLFIYDGSGQSASDSLVTAGQTYYYSAFVRDTGGAYSSGAVALAAVPSDEPPPVGPPGPGDSGGDNVPPPDPFQSFPEVVDDSPIIQQLDLGDFVFAQPGERQRFFRSGEAVPLVGGKDISVLIDYTRLPEALKTIGLTIVDPNNPKLSSSFILRVNRDKTAYTANIGALLKQGTYPIYISIINFKNQTIKRLAGHLVVGGGPVPFSQTIIGRVTSPVVTIVGLGSGLAQAVALSGQVSSFYDLYLLLVHFGSLILRAIGVRRRSAPWGVVYDSVTKRPLDPAYVIIRRGETDVTTAITDLDGRYGFFLPSGSYTLLANKTHYRFPSLKLEGKTGDELYENLYFGEPFVSAGGEVVNRNIPLDPIAFDWNEFAKEQQGFFILHSKRERRRNLIFNLLFYIGLVLASYQAIFRPSWLNLITPFFYLGILLFRYIWRKRRPAVAVKSRVTGLPIPFAVIRAFVPGVDQQVKSVVADMMGRFFLLTPPGEYYITVEEKLPDETYRQVYKSEPQKLDKGIITKDLVV
ncbi:MAG: hypothetical protein AAB455_02885 [Patescibacteria group bacterium]